MTDPGRRRGGVATGRRILLLVGPWAPARGRRPRPCHASWAWCTSPPATCSAQALRDGQPARRAGPRPTWSAATSCPTSITIAMFMDELSRPAAGARRDPRRLPAHRRARQRRWTQTLAASGERIGRVHLHRGPDRDPGPRVAGRWVCPQCGTPYHVDTDPPRVAGRCDRDGTALRQRDDDRPEVVRARAREAGPADARGGRPLRARRHRPSARRHAVRSRPSPRRSSPRSARGRRADR